jgi:hypothetical protein
MARRLSPHGQRRLWHKCRLLRDSLRRLPRDLHPEPFRLQPQSLRRRRLPQLWRQHSQRWRRRQRRHHRRRRRSRRPLRRRVFRCAPCRLREHLHNRRHRRRYHPPRLLRRQPMARRRVPHPPPPLNRRPADRLHARRRRHSALLRHRRLRARRFRCLSAPLDSSRSRVRPPMRWGARCPSCCQRVLRRPLVPCSRWRASPSCPASPLCRPPVLHHPFHKRCRRCPGGVAHPAGILLAAPAPAVRQRSLAIEHLDDSDDDDGPPPRPPSADSDGSVDINGRTVPPSVIEIPTTMSAATPWLRRSPGPLLQRSTFRRRRRRTSNCRKAQHRRATSTRIVSRRSASRPLPAVQYEKLPADQPAPVQYRELPLPTATRAQVQSEYIEVQLAAHHNDTLQYAALPAGAADGWWRGLPGAAAEAAAIGDQSAIRAAAAARRRQHRQRCGGCGGGGGGDWRGCRVRRAVACDGATSSRVAQAADRDRQSAAGVGGAGLVADGGAWRAGATRGAPARGSAAPPARGHRGPRVAPARGSGRAVAFVPARRGPAVVLRTSPSGPLDADDDDDVLGMIESGAQNAMAEWTDLERAPGQSSIRLRRWRSSTSETAESFPLYMCKCF